MCETGLYDMTGAARYLGITKRMMSENWRRWGIKHVRLGHRTIRFRREDLESWTQRKARPGALDGVRAGHCHPAERGLLGGLGLGGSLSRGARLLRAGRFRTLPAQPHPR